MKSKDAVNFVKCEKLIRNNMDVQYNFPKEDIQSDEFLKSWFRLTGDGMGGSISFCPPKEIKPLRPFKSNFYKSNAGSNIFSVYLIDGDNNICETIQSKRSILIGKVGEEISTIERLLLNEDECFTTKIEWNTFCPDLPLTDIIICDNHYFKKRDIYDDNNHELLKVLAVIPDNSPINVLIIAKEREIDLDINLEEEQKKIKEMVVRYTKCVKSSVTIITTYKSHDRNLITNYYRIKNGSCFHLKNSGIKQDVTIEIKSHAKKSNSEISLRLIEIYQEIARNPIKCFGDKKSNFLTFE